MPIEDVRVVLFIVPDGLAVDSSSAYSSDGRGLWHPHANALDTSDFQLNEVSQELAAYKNQSLYLRGTILGPGNEGHNGWTWLLRDREKKMASIDVLLGQHMPGTDPAHRAINAGSHAGIDGTPWYVSWNGRRGARTYAGMPLVLMGGASGLLKSGAGAGRYFNITAQGDRQQYGNPVIGNTFVDMQRIWATIARAAGTSVPYGGNIDPVSGIFTNV